MEDRELLELSLEKISDKIDGITDNLNAKLDTSSKSFIDKLESVIVNLAKLETKIDKMEDHDSKQNERIIILENTIQVIDRALTKQETRMTSDLMASEIRANTCIESKLKDLELRIILKVSGILLAVCGSLIGILAKMMGIM